ncbi:DUF11 domain-containing protein [Candidatus Peregrinibacteria bacterium]|nr:DUF11 domain-containing protein [Candidatus Peregrinibacteria bacterium]
MRRALSLRVLSALSLLSIASFLVALPSFTGAQAVIPMRYTNGYSADIVVTASGPAAVNRGDAFVYAYTVTNVGPSAATRVMLTQTIPAGWRFERNGSDPGCEMLDASSLTCPMGDLPDNTPRSIKVAYATSFQDDCTDVQSGVLVAATGDQADPDENTNKTSATTMIRCVQMPPVPTPAGISSPYVDRTLQRIRDMMSRHVPSSSSSSGVAQARVEPLPSPVPLRNASVRVESSASEVQPCDQVTYAIVAQNTGDHPISRASLVFEFTPGQLSIVDPGGGALKDSHVDWMLDVPAHQTRVVRVAAAVSPSLEHGSSIRTDARLLGVSGSPVGVSSVSVIAKLPQTGIGDFTSPLDDGLLRPMGGAAGAVTGFSLIAIAAIGGAMGIGLGKKYFF